MSQAEWLKHYNAVNTENILQSFRAVDEIFSDPKEVERALLEEVRGNQRYSMDMVQACTLNENGEFTIPLFDPIQSVRVQTMLNSVIKSRVTKQKIRGGALIQVSNFGLTKELNVVFEGEGVNKHIKHIECFLPAYTKQFFEPFMKEGSHELDIKDLPEDLKRLIGYRVPTEDKYSMAPLYIKGFLPQQSGSAIMLPSDITTISGSDFDVDKLYIMLPEFRVKTFDEAKARRDLNKLNKGAGNILNSKLGLESGTEEEFQAYFEANKEDYRLFKPEIEKIQYDFNKSAKENGQ